MSDASVRRTIRWGSLAGAMAAMLVLAGCGIHADRAALPSGPPASEIRIGLTEWAVAVPDVTAAVGDVVLIVTNTGASSHRLVVEGELGRWSTPLIPPGDTHSLEIRTATGESISLGCDVRGHDAHGPHDALTVAVGAP